MFKNQVQKTKFLGKGLEFSKKLEKIKNEIHEKELILAKKKKNEEMTFGASQEYESVLKLIEEANIKLKPILDEIILRKKEIDDLKVNQNNFSNLNNNLIDKIKLLRKENESLEEIKNSLNSEIEKLIPTKENINSEISRLSYKLEKNKVIFIENKNKLDGLNETISNLIEKEKKLNDSLDILNKKIDERNCLVDKLDSKIKELKEKISENENKIKITKISLTKKEKENIENEVKKEFNSTKKDLEERIKNVEKREGQLSVSLNILEIKTQQLREHKKILETHFNKPINIII